MPRLYVRRYGFRRYGRRYGLRRYGRYGRRYGLRRSYARKFVNGNSRSTIRMKCNQTITSTAVAGYGNSATSAVVYQIQPYTSSLSSIALVANPLYRAYVNLYEETKLIGYKVNIAVTSAVGGSDTPSLQIYTAFDRRHGSGEAGWTVQQIMESSSNTVATAVNNNIAKISRSIYASDLIEKAQWHDSSLNSAGTADQAWQTAGQNPNFFCPTMFLFFNSPSLGAQHNISYSLSVTYYVAFRNPKFGGSSTSSKELAVREIALPDTPVIASSVADMIADDDDGYGSGDNDMTVEEMRAQFDAAVDASEARRAIASQRAKRAKRDPVTKTV